MLGFIYLNLEFPRRDISKVVKRWYNKAPSLYWAFKVECMEIWLVGPVSAYNVSCWGAPVKCLRQARFLQLVSCRQRRNMT